MSRARQARPPVVVLVGATGTGKSGLAMAWAERWPLEIVNLDASQFYQGMDIGTAKPTAADQARVPHHLYDIVKPDEPMDAGRYVELADAAAAAVFARGRLPLFVGGTGLYARALHWGLAEIPEVPEAVRETIAAELAERGPAALHAELQKRDPAAAERISINDPQRLTRALEVVRHTGTPISEYQQQHRFASPRYEALRGCLELDPEVHRARILERVEAMFDAGFVEEVAALRDAGWSADLRTFKALGYRDAFALLAGELSRAEAVARMGRHHLRYAKRQRTWFRKEPELVHFTPETRTEFEERLAAFCETHC